MPKMAAARKRSTQRPWTDKPGLKARVREWAERIKVQINQAHVRRMSRKWASISSDGGRLTLNEELLTSCPEFCDHVIVHELLHLRVPNHGKLFKSLMNAHLPGWEEYARTERTRSGEGASSTDGKAFKGEL